MNKFLYLLILITSLSCSSSLPSQHQIESWVKATLTKEMSYIGRTSRKYIGQVYKHKYVMTNISIDNIGKLQILDENRVSVSATITYYHIHKSREGAVPKDMKDKILFVFNRSADNKWYLSAVDGRGKNTAKTGSPEDGFFLMREQILEKNSDEPL